jgi:hypothetical protein
LVLEDYDPDKDVEAEEAGFKIFKLFCLDPKPPYVRRFGSEFSRKTSMLWDCGSSKAEAADGERPGLIWLEVI